MEALILSCGTGGGHNMAAEAVAEALSDRGHTAIRLDPYQLVSDSLAETVGNAYIKLVQKSPRLFGAVYGLGNAYRRLPVRSPVYHINGKMAPHMQRYLQENHFDAIISTHVFPAEILTHMRHNGLDVPKNIFIATDYTCIPFTEESECDFYITPSPKLTAEFCARGIPEEKIRPIGIPVRRAFRSGITKEEARLRLRLSPDKRYVLLSGGSIGVGGLHTAIEALLPYLSQNEKTGLIVLCGNNEPLFSRLSEQFAAHPQIEILRSTEEMGMYLKACDIFISKPGGLSSTESAVAGIPLIHISPIPGCESRNTEFFASNGISIPVRRIEDELLPAVLQLQDETVAAAMRQKQAEVINRNAADDICALLEHLAQPDAV